MASGEQANQNSIDHFLLADNDFSNLLTNPVELRSSELEGGIGLHLSYSSALRENFREGNFQRYDRHMPKVAGQLILSRSLVRILPWCMISAVILITAYGLLHIYLLSPGGGFGKAAVTPSNAVPLSAEELKSRLDDLKWLLTVIISVASLFAILQSAASYFNALSFSKQANDGVAYIEKVAKDAEDRYPLFAQTERARTEAYRTLSDVLQFEGFDWRDLVYETMPLEQRQRILSVDWYLSVDLVPRQAAGPAYVRDLRCLANFYASKWLYEQGKGAGSLADLERAEYYLELARHHAENDFFLLNDLGVLYLEYYRQLEAKPWTKCLTKAQDLFNQSHKKYANQQRCNYNLGVAASYRERWDEAGTFLERALKRSAWEYEPLKEKECLIHYNLACAKARIGYASKTPVKEIEIDQCMQALEQVARLGMMREKTVNDDMDKATGDLYDLLRTGPAHIQARLRELRPSLHQNQGTNRSVKKGRIERAWNALWED
jgi:hypothetical protein